MSLSTTQAATALSLALCLAPMAAKADLLGVTFGGAVYSIQSSTGVATTLAPSGESFNSLTRVGSAYWSVSSFGGQLNQVNPLTGVSTPGATLTGLASESSIRGLASGPTSLFALQNEGGPGTIGPDSLYRIDLGTGAATLVGSTGYYGMQALAANAGGQLYAWDVDYGLMSIDSGTGAGSVINPSGASGVDIQTLSFSSTGTLYGGRNALYTLDTGTGAVTFVADLSGASDIRGFEFAPTPVPEPGTWAMLALGLAGLAWSTRRRSNR